MRPAVFSSPFLPLLTGTNNSFVHVSAIPLKSHKYFLTSKTETGIYFSLWPILSLVVFCAFFFSVLFSVFFFLLSCLSFTSALPIFLQLKHSLAFSLVLSFFLWHFSEAFYFFWLSSALSFFFWLFLQLSLSEFFFANFFIWLFLQLFLSLNFS